jgi:glycosyltransferase involved in cell wall biosynthesis
MGERRAGVVVVIPAYDESERIAATVAAACALPHARRVVVVDDGSADDTGDRARLAGAAVVRHDRRQGKGAALMTGAAAALDAGYPDAPLLFLDADLGASAANAEPLVTPVVYGVADLTIALFPRAPGAGGHGFVLRLARGGIERRTGWVATQPLSGQRCVSRAVFDACLPLAHGFGVEAAMTIDALRAGARVIEVPVELSHRVSDNSLRGQLHRARQYRDVSLALATRRGQSTQMSR